MQTGCKNARASSWLRVPQLHAAAGRLSPGALALWSEPAQNGLLRACLGAAPPLPRPGGGLLIASPNSRKMDQDFSQNCYGQAEICPDSLSGRHNGFVQRLRMGRYMPDISTIAFPEIFRIFRENGPRNIRNILRKWWVAAIPGPLSRNIWNISGNWSLQKMKPQCLPHICRGSPDKFGQAVRRKYEAVTSSRGSPDQFSEISGIFRKSGPGKRAQVRRTSFTVSFYRVKKSFHNKPCQCGFDQSKKSYTRFSQTRPKSPTSPSRH